MASSCADSEYTRMDSKSAGLNNKGSGDVKSGANSRHDDVISCSHGDTDISMTEDDCAQIMLQVIEPHLYDPEHLRKFLESEDMTSTVRQLAGRTGDAGAIVRSFLRVLDKHETFGMTKFMIGLLNLILKWFRQADGQFSPFKSGLISAITALLRASLDREAIFSHGRVELPCLTVDRKLLPVVRATRGVELWGTINAGYNNTSLPPLHFAAGSFLLTNVLQELLDYPEINVNAVDGVKGMTALSSMVGNDQDITGFNLNLFTSIIKHGNHSDLDVSIPDNQGMTVIDHLHPHLMKSSDESAETALQMMTLVCQHATITTDMLVTAFIRTTQWTPSSDEITYYSVLILTILGNDKFDVNAQIPDSNLTPVEIMLGKLPTVPSEHLAYYLQILDYLAHFVPDRERLIKFYLKLLEFHIPDELQQNKHDILEIIINKEEFPFDCSISKKGTAAHVAAKTGDADLLYILMNQERFDPNVKDNLGVPLLFEVCKNFQVEDAVDFIEDKNIGWDFRIKNRTGKLVCDFYGRLPYKDPVLHEILMESCGVMEENARYTESRPDDVIPIPCPERQIRWKVNPPGSADVHVTPCSSEVKQRIYSNTGAGHIYEMLNPEKGKVCIASISKFLSQRLSDLDGYVKDVENLTSLWRSIGFEVYIPECDGDQHLTAKELESSVREFSAKLTDADQCAVLCVLSHGGDGFIYGSDGDRIDTRILLSHLDNQSCPLMKGKPKVVLLQACQGNASDRGVPAVAAGLSPSSAVSASDQPQLPRISDFIVCSPSMPGYTSFVWSSNTHGSVYINSVIEIFSKFSYKFDICHLLTLVNDDVSSQEIPVEIPGTMATVDHKQMACYSSCLRRQLYLFPKYTAAETPTDAGDDEGALYRILRYFQPEA